MVSSSTVLATRLTTGAEAPQKTIQSIWKSDQPMNSETAASSPDSDEVSR